MNLLSGNDNFFLAPLTKLCMILAYDNQFSLSFPLFNPFIGHEEEKRKERRKIKRNLPYTSLKVSKIPYIYSVYNMLQRFRVLIHAQILARNLFLLVCFRKLYRLDDNDSIRALHFNITHLLVS